MAFQINWMLLFSCIVVRFIIWSKLSIVVTIIYFVTLLATAGCHGIQDSCILHNDTQHNGLNLRAPSNAMVIVVF